MLCFEERCFAQDTDQSSTQRVFLKQPKYLINVTFYHINYSYYNKTGDKNNFMPIEKYLVIILFTKVNHIFSLTLKPKR